MLICNRKGAIGGNQRANSGEKNTQKKTTYSGSLGVILIFTVGLGTSLGLLVTLVGGSNTGDDHEESKDSIKSEDRKSHPTNGRSEVKETNKHREENVDKSHGSGSHEELKLTEISVFIELPVDHT